jgi:transposase, IS5 family
MGRILEHAPGIDAACEQVIKDIVGDKTTESGAEGLSGLQIIKLGILRKRHEMTYRGLADATKDSLSMMRFLEFRVGQSLSKSAIQSNLKKIKDGTWELVNACLLGHAKDEAIEEGDSIRGDTTTTETNIHFPTDSSLMNDVVRVISRTLARIYDALGGDVVKYVDHSRRAKAKLYQINNTRGEEKRHPYYLELIRVTKAAVKYAESVLAELEKHETSDLEQMLEIEAGKIALKKYIPLGKNVIEQAYRRIVKKEEVAAAEKIFSIFEVDTDIIVKGFRDVVFGHKVSVVTGKSSLVLDLSVLDGNPKDSTLVESILNEHKESFGKFPENAAFDGCFASNDNRDFAKAGGVSNITFSKNLNMSLESLMETPKKHRSLLNFRAGIEGCISFLKRVFGFSRVLDKGLESFKSTLQCGVVAYNLTLLARINLRAQQT